MSESLIEKKLAVITVCTNRIDLAIKTLRSIDNQTGIDHDIYVVSNNITFDFTQRLYEFCVSCKRQAVIIQLTNQTSLIGLAYNIGLWFAMKSDKQYDAFAKIDDDIEFKDESSLSKAIVMNKSFDLVAIPPEGFGGKYNTDEIRHKKIEGFVSLYGACNMISKDCMKRLGFYDESAPRGVDTDFGVRAQMAGFRVAYTSFSCKHLGADVPTDGTDKMKRRRVDFPTEKQIKKHTIISDRKVRRMMIETIIGGSEKQKKA